MQFSPKNETPLDITVLGFKSLSSPNFSENELNSPSSALSSPRSPTNFDSNSDENNPLGLVRTKTLRVRRHTEADLSTGRKLSDDMGTSPRSVKSLSLDEIDPTSTSPKERRSSLRRDSAKSEPDYERRLLSQSHRKHSDPDIKVHHKHKKTTISSSSLAKAIYSIQYSFDYFETKTVLCERMLRAVLDVSGSDFGFMGFIDLDDEHEQAQPLKKLKIYSILISLDDVRLAPQQMDSMIKELEEDFARQNSIYGSAAVNRHIFLFNESPSKLIGGNPAERYLPLMKNFCGIPMYRHTKEPFEKKVLGLIGLANRKDGMYSSELVASFLPLIRACEVLVQAHQCFRQLYEQTELQKLIARMKDPNHGIELKDRRQFVRTYKSCFSGKEVVSWVAMSGGHLDVRSRDDAIRLSTKLLGMGAFHHLIGGNTPTEVQDDNTVLYSFKKEDGDTLFVDEPPSPRGSTGSDDSSPGDKGTLTRKKSRSILSHLSSEILSPNQSSSDKRYQLHSVISKKDYYTLKKKLSKKKVIDQLNSVNEKEQTALHIAIEGDDSTAVELLIAAYLSNINKVNMHLKDKNGYTPLHCAAEVGNPKILTSLLAFPGIQTNIPNSTRNTPFHCFCYRFPSPSNMKQIFDMFISRGTNVNASNVFGETPLHKAVLNPSVRLLMVRLLLESGPVEVNAFTEKGESPLHYAIHLKRRDLVSALLNYGADPNLKAKGSKSAMEIAVEEGDPEISLLISNTIELSDWLSSIDMKQYLSLFIKELVFKDVLLVINEKTLVDLGITWAGDRLRILQAIQKLKQDAEAKLRAAQAAQISQSPKVRLADFKKFRLPSAERIRMPASKSLSPVSSIEKEMKKHFEGEEWIKYSDLEFTELLGSGTSGDVYRGYYRGEEVAIKVLEKEREHRLEEFKFEFKIMSAIRGPHIVHFYGACLEPKPCLIMEYCSRGSLYDLLNDKKIDFKWPDLLRISLEMTEAIDILHNNEPQILHRDLKSMNFLVTKEWIIKVSDFGLSRFNTNTNMSTLHELRGTMSYCAPETFQGKHYTTKGDIYSLGILFWEMMYRCITGEYQRPYAEYAYLTQPLQIIVQTAQQGLRPTLPNVENVPKVFVDLVTRCWDPIPGNRPDTQEIISILSKSLDDFEADPSPWNSSILASAQLQSSVEMTI